MSGNLKGMVIVIGPRRAYFIIQFADSNGKIEEFFGHCTECHFDALGRKNIRLGADVIFVAGEREPGKSRRRALHIRIEDPSLKDLDVSTYREFGRIKTLEQMYCGNGTPGVRVGLIARGGEEEGDVLPFRSQYIISEGGASIQIGDWLQYSIGARTNSKGEISYYASEICTCVKEGENISVPEEVAEPQEDGAVYSADEKKMPLRVLISKHKN